MLTVNGKYDNILLENKLKERRFKMDKFDFMSIVQDILDECENEEQVLLRGETMIDVVRNLTKNEINFRKTFDNE